MDPDVSAAGSWEKVSAADRGAGSASELDAVVLQERDDQDSALRAVVAGEPAATATLATFYEAAHSLLRDARESELSEHVLQQCLYKLEKPKVVIPIIALVKSGKSTTLNALIGSEFLPSAAQPATASLVRVVHSEAALEGRLVLIEDDGAETQAATGREAIHSAIKFQNEKRRGDASAPLASMRLEVPIAAFANAGVDGQQLEFVDTPGPNEHGAGLEVEVQRVLRGADVIFYLLDFTKLNTDEEAAMFGMLKDTVTAILASQGSQVCRMFYILNKVDCHSKRNDPDMNDIVSSVADKLTLLLPELPMGVKHEDIVPISATNALLARSVKARVGDENFLEDFLRKAVGECFEDEYEKSEYASVAIKKAEGMEKRSGISRIEKSIIPDIAAKKGVISLLSVVDALDRDAKGRLNELKISAAALAADRDELSRAIGKMQDTKNNILENLQDLDRQCDQHTNATKEIAMRVFHDLQTDITNIVNSCFDASHDGSVLSHVRQLWHYVRGLEARTRDELRRNIERANGEVARLLNSKMEDYRLSLNNNMYQQQRLIEETLVRIVQPLLKRLADDTSDAFKIQITGEQVQLSHQDFSSFESDISGKLNALVQEKREQVRKTRTEYRTRHGACGKKWQESYDTHYTETETTGYRMDRSALRAAWSREISERIQVSQTSAEKLIEQEIKSKVEKVRCEVVSRCDKYIQCADDELNRKQNSEGETSAKAAEVSKKIAKVQEILVHLQTFRERMNAKVTSSEDSTTQSSKNGLSPA